MEYSEISPEVHDHLIDNYHVITEFEGVAMETELAVLADWGDQQVWIPKSQCVYGVDGDNGELIIAIKEWFYKKEVDPNYNE